MPVPKYLKKWQDHLNKVRKENPNKTLTECMQIAKKSYKK